MELARWEAFRSLVGRAHLHSEVGLFPFPKKNPDTNASRLNPFEKISFITFQFPRDLVNSFDTIAQTILGDIPMAKAPDANPNKPDKPEKPAREKRSLYARHIASWKAKDFKDLLDLTLERLTQDKGKLVEVSYSTAAAASSVASPLPEIHYSAVVWYELPKGGKPPESEVPAP